MALDYDQLDILINTAMRTQSMVEIKSDVCAVFCSMAIASAVHLKMCRGEFNNLLDMIWESASKIYNDQQSTSKVLQSSGIPGEDNNGCR